MKGGCPPTAPKARAGLLTPPGITRQARWKASRLRTRSVFIRSSRRWGGGSRPGPGQALEELLGLAHLRLEVALAAVQGHDVQAQGPGGGDLTFRQVVR